MIAWVRVGCGCLFMLVFGVGAVLLSCCWFQLWFVVYVGGCFL